MNVIDPGHSFDLDVYDAAIGEKHHLVFMKREGVGYPGNVGSYSGTNCQEVIRALISRSIYLNGQISCGETEAAIASLRFALWLFEARASRRHGLVLAVPVDGIETVQTCKMCGHIKCNCDVAQGVLMNVRKMRHCD